MTSTPEPLPSLPPSPVPERRKTEDDIAAVWHEDEPTVIDARIHLKPGSAARKGKGNGKNRAVADEDEDDDYYDEGNTVVEGYPPTKEEEAESRRVEENLRRWEVAERQRRKAARESASLQPSSSTGSASNNAPSLFADLFRRDSRKVPLGGVGTHHVLSSTDDVVQLEDLDTPSIDRFSPLPSPTPEVDNPFDTPSASRTSLNIPAQSAIMTESDSMPDELAREKGTGAPQPSTLSSSSSSSSGLKVKGKGRVESQRRSHPPPKPLDLPAPRDPPPPTGIPHTDRPPEPVLAPSVEPTSDPEETGRERTREREEEQRPVRWWHEWLCGCGEGPDRGGDHQAGRTNPFE